MATRVFNILPNGDKGQMNEPDGIIEHREKEEIGGAWNRQGPNDKYIKCQLKKGFWIVTDEEKDRMISEDDYELLQTAKSKLGE